MASVVEIAGSETDKKKPLYQKVATNLYRRSCGTYYAWLKCHGRQERKCLGNVDRKAAERLLADFKRQVQDAGRQEKNPGNVSFKTLSKEWLADKRGSLKPRSFHRVGQMVEGLNQFFKDAKIRKITPGLCRAWEAERGEGLAASTFNQDRATLISILAKAVDSNIIFKNPALVIKRRKPFSRKPIIPSKAEFERLVNTLRDAGAQARHGANLVELLAYSGMRLAEATALKWRDVDFERGLFYVRGGEDGTKNREVRAVQLFPSLREFLIELKDGEEVDLDQYVIPTTTARKALLNACRKAKLPHFHHHCLRHFFASNCIDNGTQFNVLAQWLGHKDGGELAFKTYVHLRDERLVEMARQVTYRVPRRSTPTVPSQPTP